MYKTVKHSIIIVFVVMLTLSMSAMSIAATTGIANEPQVLSFDAQTGVEVIQDVAGGIVISGLSAPIVHSTSERQQQLSDLSAAVSAESALTNRISSVAANYYDTENNPIYIGTWEGNAAYARHTLGTYNQSQAYLTSYGDCSWYNTSGNSALPYRNGAANNNSGQGVVDVAKFDYFSIRDIGTDNATSLQITDWGPSQNTHPSRIADIDKYDFISLHGNSSDGLFYCRTWVPITNYNP